MFTMHRYDRKKHTVPGRDVFGLLAAHHETNPTPRKPKTSRAKLSDWEESQQRLTIAWINSQIEDKGLKVRLMSCFHSQLD